MEATDWAAVLVILMAFFCLAGLAAKIAEKLAQMREQQGRYVDRRPAPDARNWQELFRRSIADE